MRENRYSQYNILPQNTKIRRGENSWIWSMMGFTFSERYLKFNYSFLFFSTLSLLMCLERCQTSFQNLASDILSWGLDLTWHLFNFHLFLPLCQELQFHDNPKYWWIIHEYLLNEKLFIFNFSPFASLSLTTFCHKKTERNFLILLVSLQHFGTKLN